MTFDMLTADQQQRLVKAMLGFDCINKQSIREAIINHLPDAIKHNLQTVGAPYEDVLLLIDRCSQFQNGIPLLVREIAVRESDSRKLQVLYSLLNYLLPEVLSDAYGMSLAENNSGHWKTPDNNRGYIETRRCREVVNRLINLITERNVKGVFLHGEPGIGKAILAREAYRQQQSQHRFPYGFWVRIPSIKFDVDAKMTFDDILQEILAFHGMAQQGNTSNVRQKLSQAILLLEQQPTLLVMLNMENIDNEDNKELLAHFLQNFPTTSFLIMTKLDAMISSMRISHNWIDYALTEVKPFDEQDLRTYLLGRIDEHQERTQEDRSGLRNQIEKPQFLEQVRNYVSGNPRKLDLLVSIGDFDTFLQQQKGTKADQIILLNSINNLDSPRLKLLLLIYLFQNPTETRIREAWNSTPIENESSDKTDLDEIVSSLRHNGFLVPSDTEGGGCPGGLQITNSVKSELSSSLATNEGTRGQAWGIARKLHLAWACGIFRAASNWEIDAGQYGRLMAERDELNEVARHWTAERLPLVAEIEEAAAGLLLPMAHFEHNAGNWTRAKNILDSLKSHLEMDARREQPELTLAQRCFFSARANLLIARQAAHERDMKVADEAVNAAIEDVQKCGPSEARLLRLEVQLRQAMAQMDLFDQVTTTLREEQNSKPEEEFAAVTEATRDMRTADTATALPEQDKIELLKIEISAYGYLAELKLKRSILCGELTSLNSFFIKAKECLDKADPLIDDLKWDRPRTHHLRLRGDICRLDGEWNEARKEYKESLEVARRSGNQDERLYGWNNLGLAEIEEDPLLCKEYTDYARRVFNDSGKFPNEFRRAKTMSSYCLYRAPRIFLTGTPAAGKTTARDRVSEILMQNQWLEVAWCGMEEALRAQLPVRAPGQEVTDYRYEADGALILADHARERLLMNAVSLLEKQCFDADAAGRGFLTEVGHPNPLGLLLINFRPLLRGALIIHLRAGLEERKRRNARRVWRVPEKIVSAYGDRLGDEELDYLERAGATIKVIDAQTVPTIEQLQHHIDHVMAASSWVTHTGNK